MRCPYCGVSNGDQARYCVHCGRDMTTALHSPGSTGTGMRQPPQQPQQPTQRYPAPPPSSVPTQPPYQSGRPGQPQPPAPNVRVRPQAASVPVAAPEPAPPVAFPPKTVEQLRGLEQGALTYTVVNTTTNAEWKKTVRVVFSRCAPWQQVATLLKVLKEQMDTNHETIVVQGVQPQEPDVYGFTNGQITFDRHARLGSEVMTRYLLGTNDGFAGDSVRVVLTE